MAEEPADCNSEMTQFGCDDFARTRRRIAPLAAFVTPGLVLRPALAINRPRHRPHGTAAMPKSPDDLFAYLDGLGIEVRTKSPSAAVHGRRFAGAARRDRRRTHQEPVPQGQEGQFFPRHGRRGGGSRPEADPPCHRGRKPGFLRQAGTADGTSGRHARRGDRLRPDQRSAGRVKFVIDEALMREDDHQLRIR